MYESLRTRLLALTVLLAVCLAAAASSPEETVNLAAGEDIYNRCIGCHSPDRNRTGPMHCGILGRAAGSVEGFEYSRAMRDADITWTAEALDRFLQSPFAMVPGTTMGFAGLADATERKQLVAWLATLTAASPHCAGLVNDPGNTKEMK